MMRLLMTKDGATFKGRHYQLANASYHPRPVQRPHPPIWIGAGGEQLMLPIVARQADAWHAFGSEPSMARKSRLVDQLAEKAGRDPKTILRSASLSLSRTGAFSEVSGADRRASISSTSPVDTPIAAAISPKIARRGRSSRTRRSACDAWPS